MSRHMRYAIGPLPCPVLPLVTACVADQLLPFTDTLGERDCALPSRPGAATCNCKRVQGTHIIFCGDASLSMVAVLKMITKRAICNLVWSDIGCVSGLVVRTPSNVAVARIDNARCCLCNSLLLPSVLLCTYQLPRCRAAMPGDRQQILKPRLSSSLLLSSFPPTSTSINWQHIPNLYQLPPQLHTQPARSAVRTAIMHHTLSLVALAAMAQAACPTKPLW